MHDTDIEPWRHHHIFNVEKRHVEKRTLFVVLITLVTMILEILFGWLSNSMALLADGWHMGTHAFALGISLVAYVLARRYAHDRRFSFGTWKIEILGAYSSAIVLALAGIAIVYSSAARLIHPLHIHFNEALTVAVIGLAVNLICAVILAFDPHADEAHDHHVHHDLNLKSAYLHIVADAITSVLAVAALLGAKYLQLLWLDPVMGLVGAALILHWSVHLLRDTAAILLDHEVKSPLADQVIEQIEADGHSRVSDLHLWRVGDRKYACIVSVVTTAAHTMEDYKKRLSLLPALAHVTIEVCRHSVRGEEISIGEIGGEHIPRG